MEKQNRSEKYLLNRPLKQLSQSSTIKAFKQMPKTSKIGIGTVTELSALRSQLAIQEKTPSNLFKINKRLYPSLKPLKERKPLEPLRNSKLEQNHENDEDNGNDGNIKIKAKLKVQETQIKITAPQTERIIKNPISSMLFDQQNSQFSELPQFEKNMRQQIDKFYQQNNSLGVSLKIIDLD